MSHNHAGHVPYVTDCTSIFSTAGSQSLVIQGYGLGLSTQVDIPSALGVETARSFTKTGATQGVLTLTVTIETIPAPAVNRSITISNGGIPVQGPSFTNGTASVLHGWSVSLLNPCVWFDADDASTFVLDGDDIVSWTDKSTNALVATQSTAGDRPQRVVKTQHSSGTATGNVYSSIVSGDQLDLPSPFIEVADSDGQFTHFVVISLFSYGNYRTWYRFGAGFTPAWQHSGMSSSNGGAFMHKTTTGASTGGTRTAIGSANYLGNEVAHLVTYIGDSTDGYSCRLNGTEVDAPDGDTPLQDVNPAAVYHPHAFPSFIGDRCYIAEMIQVPRRCTSSEITTAEAYLNAKWGVYS